MKLLKLTDEVFQYYKENVKGNENISEDQAARKLTRNVLLAMPVPQRSPVERLIGNMKYIYGNLYIVVRRNKVVHISNQSGGKRYGGWFKDQAKYDELTKLLEIAE